MDNTSNSKMPNTAEGWAKLFLGKQLPSPFRIGKLVQKELDQGTPSYKQLAEQLNHDPVLSFSVMAEANRAKPGSNPASKTLDHAISMIGTESLSSLIKNQAFEPASPDDLQAYYYTRTLSTGLYAAHLGKKISERKAIGNTQDIFWSSLFWSVPNWFLWRYATPEMRLIRYAIRNNFKLPDVAEEEVLGCTILEIAGAMMQQINLSELIKACFDSNNVLNKKQWVSLARIINKDGNYTRPPEDRNLLIHMQSPQFVVMLANMLAESASHDWYSRATLRTQRILAAYLKCPLSDAVALTHQVAASMSRAHPISGVMLPATKLFIAPRERIKAGASVDQSAPDQLATSHAKAQAKPANPTAPDKPTPAAESKRKTAINKEPEASPIFKELTEIMIHRPDEFSDLHELMNAATQGIAYGVDLARASVSLVNNDRSRLKAYYSVGCRDQSALTTFETQIVKGTIFGKLIERPASIWVKPSSSEKIKKIVPINFKQVVETDEFLLMSVFVGKKPVAIFHADNFPDGAIQDHQYKQFKFMCGAVSTALQHQAARKKQNQG